MVGTLSVPPAYLPSISLLRRLSTTTQLDVARDVESRELPISVPFSQIAKMPLRFVLGLRELDAFSDIRKLLSKYRTYARRCGKERCCMSERLERMKEVARWTDLLSGREIPDCLPLGAGVREQR